MKLRSALLLVLAATVCALGGLISPQVAAASVDAVTQWPAMPPIVSNTAAVGNVTGKFTVGAGNNRVLLVAVATQYTSGNPVIAAGGVTYGGTALTNIASATNTTGLNKIWVGYLPLGTATTTSTANIAVTNTGTAGLVATYVTAAVYSGVDQTTPITGSGSASGSTATLTTSNFAVTGLNGNNGLAAFISNFTGSTTSLSSVGTAIKVREYKGTIMSIGAGAESVVTNAADNMTVTASAAVSGVLAGIGLNPATRIATNSTCGDCHGNPPQDGTARNVPPGQFPGAHDKHTGRNANQYTYACTECHYNAVGYNHSTGFKNISGTRVPRNTYGGTTNLAASNAPVYTQTCTKSTCHSSGRANIQYSASPTWNGTSTCQSCHGGRNAGGTYVKSTTGFSMSTTHGQHLGKYTATEINCQMCHGKTAQNNTALKNYTGSNYHANGNKTVYFTDIAYGSYTSYKASGADAGKCTNTACHGGKSRSAWTNQGNINTNNTCTHCHGVAATSAALANVAANRKFFAPGWGGTGTSTDQLTATNDPRVGAHFVHLSSVYMSKLKCNECHYVPVTPFDTTNGGTHMKNTRYNSQSLNFAQASSATISIGVASGSTPSQLTSFTGYTSGTSTKAATCSSVYCHGNRLKNNITSGTARKPSWNQDTLIASPATTTSCAKCHGYPPTDGSLHQPTDTTCNTCHSHVATGVNPTTFLDKSKHINGRVDGGGVAHSLPYPGATHKGDVTASCTNCHTNVSGTYPTLVGTKPDCRSCHTLTASGSGCNSCHGTDGSGKPSGGGTVLGAFPNYSGSHTKHVVGQGMACTDCHFSYGSNTAGHGSSGATGTAQGTAHNNVTFVGLSSPNGKFHATKTTTQATCSNVSCHGTAVWGVTKFNCVTCHASAVGSRAAISGEFASQSHHVQGAELPLTPSHCAKCHWEANADGSVNKTYHQGVQNAGAGVSLIVWTATTRPASPTAATLVAYTANGTRSQIAKLNAVCLGCHNSAGIPAANMFGTYASNFYSPEPNLPTAKPASSILSRYSTTRTVAWSNYNYSTASKFGTNGKKNITKALSAHGNAIKNEFPNWDPSQNGKGEDGFIGAYAGDIAPATLGKNRNVLCYDCHNSHGSDASGITSSYSSATGGSKTLGGKGGILKTTVIGQRGYDVTYKPAARTITYRNYSTIGQTTATTTSALFNTGASICNDCHNNATAIININKPWSITGTYSSTKAIVGYWSTPYFDNYTFASAIRTPYKKGGTLNGANDRRRPMGGHFGSSIPSRQASHGSEVNGLCTPCHDPHGVSKSALSVTDQAYAVPLLKGTWVTTPYKEDKAGIAVKRGGGSRYGGMTASGAIPGYHIDQNTLVAQPAPVNGGAAASTSPTNQRSESFAAFTNSANNQQTIAEGQFAGLCIGCHSKASLTNSTQTGAATWKNKARVHQSVKGWAAAGSTNAGNVVHAYTCSKCHAPHVSRLPRLMVTNCLDVNHFKQLPTSSISSATPTTATAGNIWQSSASSGKGAGRFPGGGTDYQATVSGQNQNIGPWWFAPTPRTTTGTRVDGATANYGSNCHNQTNAGGATYNPTNQKWNRLTPW